MRVAIMDKPCCRQLALLFATFCFVLAGFTMSHVNGDDTTMRLYKTSDDNRNRNNNNRKYRVSSQLWQLESAELPRDNELDQSGQDDTGQSHDAGDSWRRFVKRSRKPEKGRVGKKRKLSRLPEIKESRGPTGPRGPPGPPGAIVTMDTIMEEFQQLVKEEAEKRAELLLALRCGGCAGVHNDTGKFQFGELDIVPRLSAGFFQTLTQDISLDPLTFLELKHYVMPFAAGSFQRGDNFSSETGRYTVPRDGVYNIIANLHIRHPGFKARAPRRLRRSEHVRALICIQSQCEQNTSLGYISGLQSNSDVFTINFSGFLNLKREQYISIYIDNSSRRNLKVLKGSSFMCTLTGT